MKYINIVLIVAMLLLSGVAKGQIFIKKLILDDLLLLNKLSDSCIFQNSQEYYFINGNDTQHHVKTIDSVCFLTNMIQINKIDTVGSYLYVNVSIHIIPYYQLSFLFKDQSFNYVIKIEDGRAYKIYGFLMSEVLLCSFKGHYDDIILCKYLNIKYRDLRRGNVNAISRVLKIAVFNTQKSHYIQELSRSYIVPKICKTELR